MAPPRKTAIKSRSIEEDGSGTVDDVKVVDLLTDTIKELNRPCVEAPAAPAERTEAERKRDAAEVLRALLHELEGGDAAGAAAGRNASSQRYAGGFYPDYLRLGEAFSENNGNRDEYGYNEKFYKETLKLQSWNDPDWHVVRVVDEPSAGDDDAAAAGRFIKKGV